MVATQNNTSNQDDMGQGIIVGTSLTSESIHTEVDEPTTLIHCDKSKGAPPDSKALRPTSSNSPFFRTLHRLYERHLLSLSRASTTPGYLSLLIPLASILTHVIFLYGQTSPMGQLHLSKQIHVWTNATTTESKTVMDVLGLQHNHSWSVHEENNIKTLTYWVAIEKLWKGEGLTVKILTRIAAFILVIFSGIWPHMKLLLLNITWLFSINQRRRTRMLHWLAVLGKWSLADVFAVCVMVGFLSLDWKIDPHAIQDGLIHNMPTVLNFIKSLYSASDICTMALKRNDCHVSQQSLARWAQCKSCIGFVQSTLDNPEDTRATFKRVVEDGMDLSGGGMVALRAMGLHGIYVFCVAVLMSCLISFVVDIFDVRNQHYNTQISVEQRQGNDLLRSGTEEFDSNNGGEIEDKKEVRKPTTKDDHFHNLDKNPISDDLENGNDGAQSKSIVTMIEPTHRLFAIGLLTFCLATALAVGAGIFSNTMERNVQGAIAILLHDVLGFVWTRKYSLFTLVETTGDAGRWDYLLMGTFGLFVVVGPAVRAFLCLIAWIVPWQAPSRHRILACIAFVGVFCAWEVFIVAGVMMALLMPAITSTVVIRPECALVSEDGNCLRVNFEMQEPFLWILIGSALLVGVSNLMIGTSTNYHSDSPRTINGHEADENEICKGLHQKKGMAAFNSRPYSKVCCDDDEDTLENSI